MQYESSRLVANSVNELIFLLHLLKVLPFKVSHLIWPTLRQTNNHFSLIDSTKMTRLKFNSFLTFQQPTHRPFDLTIFNYLRRLLFRNRPPFVGYFLLPQPHSREDAAFPEAAKQDFRELKVQPQVHQLKTIVLLS